MKKIIQPLISLFFAVLLTAGNPVNVPLGHPVYHFLDRIESMGVLDNVLDGVKPFDRSHVAELLQQIDQNREKLTSIDREKLDNLLLDFRYEIDPEQKYANQPSGQDWYSPFDGWQRIKTDFFRVFAQNQPEEENHLFLWEDGGNSFYFDFIYDITMDSRSDEVRRNKDMMTFSARGTIAENFGYSVQVAMATLRGDLVYRNNDPLLKKTWRNNREDATYFDRSSGDIAYRSPYVDFRFAVQPVSWGLGESGQLILSDNAEQFPYFSVSKYWSWGSFTFLHGKLLATETGRTEENQAIFPDKWLTANRFEFSPLTGMAVGLTGMIVYGNRSADWAYLFPINYFRAVEHNLRDRDNALLALDVESRITSGFKMYGTLFLDELRKDKLGTDWYGNKHGFQIGMHLVDPLGIPNLAARFEYTAIMPWVYTHKYNVNRFMNDSLSLGHWAGPNSQVIYFHIEKEWHRRLSTGIKWQRWQHGANYPDENIGGDIYLGHSALLGDQEQARETRHFLEGIPEQQNRFELYIRYEVFNDIYLNLAAIKIRSEVDRQKTDLTEVHFGFHLNY